MKRSHSMVVGAVAFLIAIIAMRGAYLDVLSSNEDQKVQPTTLYLTIVSENLPPAVCELRIATETLIGDNLRVVVEKGKCPALQ